MFFVETTPRMFCLNKQFRLKNHHVAKDTFNETDKFCWQLKDGINNIVENQSKFDCFCQSEYKRKTALQNSTSQNDCGKVHVFNDTDKNIEPANAV